MLQSARANLADSLILFPSTHPIQTYGARAEIFEYPDGKLEIWRVRTKAALHRRPDVYLLTFWGNGDRADGEVGGIANSWGQRAVEIWGVNYPGYGRSTGPARLDRLALTGERALALARKEAHGRPIIIFGASLGTTVALHLSATRHVDGLMLNNPPPLRQLLVGHFGWWNLWILARHVASEVPPELDSIKNARATHAPAVFFLSDHDRLVPPKYHRMVSDAYAGPKQIRILHDAGHNSPISGPSLQSALDWLISDHFKSHKNSARPPLH
jgi:pimeloyl-ACP methyl ester carboxylesterase